MSGSIFCFRFFYAKYFKISLKTSLIKVVLSLTLLNYFLIKNFFSLSLIEYFYGMDLTNFMALHNQWGII